MRIVNFGQVVDVDRGLQLTHQMTVELQSGDRVQILTDERTVQQLVDVATGVSEEQARGASFVGSDYPQDVSDFGEAGLEDPSDLFDDPPIGTMEEPLVQREPSGGGLGSPKPPVDEDGFYLPPKARTVPKDELGYPIVPRKKVSDDGDLDDGEDDGAQI